MDDASVDVDVREWALRSELAGHSRDSGLPTLVSARSHARPSRNRSMSPDTAWEGSCSARQSPVPEPIT
jgi:hypothetical protein